MEKKLKVGEVVWAKVKGFPWWPGIIGRIEENISPHQQPKILVNFIGDPSHAEIPISKIENYERKFEDFSKTKKKTLLNSINLANNIIRRKLSFNNHLKFRKSIIEKKNPSNMSLTKHKNKDDSESETFEDVIKPKKKNFLTHKRLRKFLNENNHHLNENQYNKRVKTNYNINEEFSNLHRQITGTTRADSEEAMVGEHEKRKEISVFDEVNNEEISKKNLDNVLTVKIKELLLSKIELPSSSLNKSMINLLDQIHNLIVEIETEELFESVMDLLPFLNCLMMNKNENLALKSLALSNLIRKKIIESLFNFKEKFFLIERNSYYSEDQIDKEEMYSELVSLSKKEFQEIANKSENYKSNSAKSKFTKKNSAFSRITNFYSNSPKSSDNSNLTSSKEFLNMNIDLNPTREVYHEAIKEEQEEINSVSEISLDSHKTDCEEIKVAKSKVSIRPLDHKAICEILFEYFVDINLCKLDHVDLVEILVSKEFFQNVNKEKEKSKNPIKHHYMRKRVCYKLYKVFGKLMKLIKLDKDIIKNLSIYLELRAREKDPDMGEQYRNFISTIFFKIKDKLMMMVTNPTSGIKLNPN